MATLIADLSKVTEKIRPLHGVNGGTKTNALRNDASYLFKEAGFPYARLHDTEIPYGSGEFVDVNAIFKNPRADVNDPKSYNFKMTDAFITAIIEAGTEPLFRLGISIDHGGIKRYIWPPEDYQKWAEICEHIIRHYTEGWADGFNYKIEYWEIWNEPNHYEDHLMWGGTPEDFAHLFAIAATHLKSKFPHLKIGGPAFSHPSQAQHDFVYRFFTELTKDGAHPPIDFYSWHGYANTIELAEQRAQLARKTLDRFGYQDVKIGVYDEWNYIKTWRNLDQARSVIKSYKGTAFDAAMMCAMHDQFVHIMCYYGVYKIAACTYNGLFDVEKGTVIHGQSKGLVPLKPFYAFKAYNELYKLGNRIDVENNDNRIYSLAAKNGEKASMLISYYAEEDEKPIDKELHLKFKSAEGKKATVYVCNENNDLRKTAVYNADTEIMLTIEPYTVLYIEIN